MRKVPVFLTENFSEIRDDVQNGCHICMASLSEETHLIPVNVKRRAHRVVGNIWCVSAGDRVSVPYRTLRGVCKIRCINVIRRSRPSQLTLCWSLRAEALQATANEGLVQGPYVVASAGFEPATPGQYASSPPMRRHAQQNYVYVLCL